jgi:hypothetical protein
VDRVSCIDIVQHLVATYLYYREIGRAGLVSRGFYGITRYMSESRGTLLRTVDHSTVAFCKNVPEYAQSRIKVFASRKQAGEVLLKAMAGEYDPEIPFLILKLKLPRSFMSRNISWEKIEFRTIAGRFAYLRCEDRATGDSLRNVRIS